MTTETEPDISATPYVDADKIGDAPDAAEDDQNGQGEVE